MSRTASNKKPLVGIKFILTAVFLLICSLPSISFAKAKIGKQNAKALLTSPQKTQLFIAQSGLEPVRLPTVYLRVLLKAKRKGTRVIKVKVGKRTVPCFPKNKMPCEIRVVAFKSIEVVIDYRVKKKKFKLSKQVPEGRFRKRAVWKLDPNAPPSPRPKVPAMERKKPPVRLEVKPKVPEIRKKPIPLERKPEIRKPLERKPEIRKPLERKPEIRKPLARRHVALKRQEPLPPLPPRQQGKGNKAEEGVPTWVWIAGGAALVTGAVLLTVVATSPPQVGYTCCKRKPALK